MKREDAIKTLRELRRETHDSWYENVYDMAIEALSGEAIQGWIPVTERLPDVDVEVLTTTNWSDVLIAWLGKGGAWETEELILDNDEILAWMPLPESYREDGEA